MKERHYIIGWFIFIVIFVVAAVIFGGAAGLLVAYVFQAGVNAKQLGDMCAAAGSLMAFPASFVAFRIAAAYTLKKAKQANGRQEPRPPLQLLDQDPR